MDNLAALMRKSMRRNTVTNAWEIIVAPSGLDCCPNARVGARFPEKISLRHVFR